MQIDTICITGGGIKIYAIIGAIIELEKTLNLNQITRYIGSSSGSIIALLLNLGMNGKEILDFTNENNLKKVDERFLGIPNYFRKIHNLRTSFGLNRSTTIEKSIRDILVKRGYSQDCTFEELYQKTNKIITITATSVSDRDTYYFNHITMPKMKIFEAISMSTSYPLYFTSKSYIINGKKHLFNDGGIIDNFPILYYNLCDTNSEIFLNNIKSISKQTRDILFDSRLTKVLGIYILDNNYTTDIKDLYKGYDTINNISTFMNSLVKTMTDKIDNLNLLQYHQQTDTTSDVWKYIISIPLQFEVNSVSFNVPNELKNMLLDNGIKATKNYMENFNEIRQDYNFITNQDDNITNQDVNITVNQDANIITNQDIIVNQDVHEQFLDNVLLEFNEIKI